MLAALPRGDYEQVEAGRCGPEASTRLQASGQKSQRTLVGWLLLWSVSLVATFFLGQNLAAAKAQDPAASATSEVAGIVSLAQETPSLWQVYDRSFKSARYVDLTHAFSPKIPVWGGFGAAKVKGSVAGSDMEGFAEKGETFSYLKQGFVATSYELTTDQYGTQLDPPAHWNEYGATISDIPPTFALRPLVIINIAPKVEEMHGYHAGVRDVKDWEKIHGKIPEGSVVFFRSDWSKKWKEYETRGLPSTYPGVALDTLKFLHHERHILFHGHEPLDTDMTPTLEGEAWLMHHNFAQAEGVANLHQVPEFGCLVSIGFAKAHGGSGGYARFVAVCPEDSTSAGTTIEESPGAPLPMQPHPLRRDANGVLAPDEHAEDTAYCSVKGALGCGEDGKVW